MQKIIDVWDIFILLYDSKLNKTLPWVSLKSGTIFIHLQFDNGNSTACRVIKGGCQNSFHVSSQIFNKMSNIKTTCSIGERFLTLDFEITTITNNYYKLDHLTNVQVYRLAQPQKHSQV